jgi:hypothetical protein
MTSLTETRLATLERVSPELLEVRFKPGQKIDLAGVHDILIERQRMCNGEPYHVLAVLPPDADFEMSVMTQDHYRGLGLERCTRSLAWAATDMLAERMASLYYAYFPQPFPTRVFTEEAEARKWLLEQVADRSMN